MGGLKVTRGCYPNFVSASLFNHFSTLPRPSCSVPSVPPPQLPKSFYFSSHSSFLFFPLSSMGLSPLPPFQLLSFLFLLLFLFSDCGTDTLAYKLSPAHLRLSPGTGLVFTLFSRCGVLHARTDSHTQMQPVGGFHNSPVSLYYSSLNNSFRPVGYVRMCACVCV